MDPLICAEYLCSGVVAALTSMLGGRLQRTLLQNLLSSPSKREDPLYRRMLLYIVDQISSGSWSRLLRAISWTPA